MVEEKYSGKEIAILNGMINLIKNGANPYSVKVSDIAESAGVGKGTIYEYFETKEEVIVKALFFNISNEIKILGKRIDAKKGFKEKYYEILDIIVENLLNKFSTFNLLISAGGLPEIYRNKCLKDGIEGYLNHIIRTQEIIDDLLATGYKEGEIKEIESVYYRRMVVKSSLFVFGNYMALQSMYKDTSIQEAMEYSYKVVIKSLN